MPAKLIAATLLGAAFSSMPAIADRVTGVETIAVDSPSRAQPIDVTLWFPATEGGVDVLIGDSAIFQGVNGQMNTPQSLVLFRLF